MNITINKTNMAKSAIRDIFIQMPTRSISLSNWNGYKNFIIRNYGKDSYINAMKSLKNDKWITKTNSKYQWKKEYTPVNELKVYQDKNIIFEHNHDYGCLMLKLNFPLWNKLIEKIVDSDDVFYDKGLEYGYEREPHCTILYGFHDNTNIDDIEKILKLIKNPIKIQLTHISSFTTPTQFDVIKFDVQSELLTKLNKIFRDNFNYTSSFDDYHPHVTIAYVKKGTSDKYIKKLKQPIILYSKEFKYTFGWK